MNGQWSLFEGSQPLKIDKPIRLIELFAGYGSQALALKYLGVPFEHWRISEWAVNSIQAYRDMHFGDVEDPENTLPDNEILDFLDGKISSDYNTPMKREQIKRTNYRRIFNNMVVSHNVGSIVTASSLRHLAGDSIVVDVLMAIFGGMILLNNGEERHDTNAT